MKDLGHPARPVFHNESDVDVTTHPDEESDAEEVEDYHSNILRNTPTKSGRNLIQCMPHNILASF